MGPSNARLRLAVWLKDAVAPLPASGLDAAELAAAAEEQGLVGPLRVLSAGDPRWPESVQRRLAAGHRVALARGIRLLDLAARVQRRLLTEGLRSLPMKGAAVAELLYDSVAERPMSDVDILVLDDFASASRVLLAEGFLEREQADHATAWIDPGSGAILELHRSPTSCPGLFALDGPGLWSRSRPGAGQVGRRPGAEDLLLQLALHAAFQHGGVLSLVQHLDLRRALERDAVDSDRLLSLARAARAEAPLAAALLIAERVVGARLPPRLAAGLEAALGPRLRRSLAARPILDFVVPTPPALFFMRYGLVPGRRVALIARTLAPRPGPGQRSWPRQALAAAARGADLAWRFFKPPLRPTPSPPVPRS